MDTKSQKTPPPQTKTLQNAHVLRPYNKGKRKQIKNQVSRDKRDCRCFTTMPLGRAEAALAVSHDSELYNHTTVTCSGAKYSGVPQSVKAFVNPSLDIRYSMSTA